MLNQLLQPRKVLTFDMGYNLGSKRCSVSDHAPRLHLTGDCGARQGGARARVILRREAAPAEEEQPAPASSASSAAAPHSEDRTRTQQQPPVPPTVRQSPRQIHQLQMGLSFWSAQMTHLWGVAHKFAALLPAH